jgi:hypothetical protein
MTLHDTVELAKTLLPVLISSTVVLALIALAEQSTIRRLQRELRRVRADRNRLEDAVGTYERIDDLRTETIDAIRRRGRG